MARKSALVIALMAALSASGAHALGMGDIVVRSGLNQPLEAEIPLVSAQDVDVEVLRANLASPEDFTKAGVERSYFLNSIRFSPGSLPDGRKVLRLRTRDPVKEPFLNFIIEVSWPAGRMQREYTLLMDPPVFAQERRPAAYTPPVSREPAAASAARTAAPADTGSYSGETYGPTGGSDTLWGIANKVRNGRSTAQTMVALYQANPNAFASRNMNSLKQGQTLQVPGGESIDAVSMAEARRQMIAHNQAWATRSGVADQPRAVVEAGQGAAPAAAAPVETGDGRLKLVTPTKGDEAAVAAGRGAEGDGGLREKLSATVEAQETLAKENEELRAQMGLIASQVEKLERLVKLKDEQLAALQTGQPMPAAPADGGPTEAAPAEAAPAEVSPGAGQAAGTEPAAPAPIPAAKPMVAAPAAAQPAVRTAPSSEEPDLLARILAEPMWLAAGGAVLVLLLGALLMRRRQAADEDYHPVVAPVAVKATAKAAEPVAAPAVELEIPEIEERFAEAEAAPALSTSVNFDTIADPLGEADIYIAYGKYPQAEELLKATLARDPARHEARLKLLECYAETRNRNAFDAEALRLKDAAALDDSIAARAAELFENAWHGERFTLLGEVPRKSEAGLPSADDIFANLDVGAEAEPRLGGEPKPGAGLGEMEFALDESAATQGFAGFGQGAPEEKFEFDLSPGATPAAAEQGLEFNLEGFEPPKAEPTAEPKPLAEALDFNLEQDLAAFDTGSTTEATPVRAEAAMEFETIEQAPAETSFAGLAAEDEDLLAGSDEAATKLDLARAYIDMGDVDGARDILGEVLVEGSLEQKQEAEALLAKLA